MKKIEELNQMFIMDDIVNQRDKWKELALLLCEELNVKKNDNVDSLLTQVKRYCRINSDVLKIHRFMV